MPDPFGAGAFCFPPTLSLEALCCSVRLELAQNRAGARTWAVGPSRRSVGPLWGSHGSRPEARRGEQPVLS